MDMAEQADAVQLQQQAIEQGVRRVQQGVVVHMSIKPWVNGIHQHARIVCILLLDCTVVSTYWQAVWVPVKCVVCDLC